MSHHDRQHDDDDDDDEDDDKDDDDDDDNVICIVASPFFVGEKKFNISYATRHMNRYYINLIPLRVHLRIQTRVFAMGHLICA